MGISLSLPFLWLAIAAMVTVASGIDARAQAWTNTPITNTTESPGWFPTVAIGPALDLHIVYAASDRTNQNYTTNAGGSFSAKIPLYPKRRGNEDYSFLVDENSRLHYVVSLEYENTLRLHEMTGKPGDFSPLQLLDPTSTEPEEKPVIVADAVGGRHLVYLSEGKVRYRSMGPQRAWSAPITISGKSATADDARIAVTPNGKVAITFVTHSTVGGVDTIWYVENQGATFDAPVAIATGQVPGDGAPIMIDRDGVSHLLFLQQLPAGSEAVVGYMENGGGAWKATRFVSPPGDYRGISAAIDRADRIHVALVLRDAGGRYDLGYMRGEQENWTTPANITSTTGFDEFAHGRGNGFLQTRDSVLAISYYTTALNRNCDIGLLTTTLTFPPRLPELPDTIDFGELPVGDCADTTVTLLDAERYASDSLRLDPLLIDPAGTTFQITSGSEPVVLGVDDSRTIALRFCAERSGSFQALLIIVSNAGRDTIVLKARGAGEEERRIRIDSTTMRVGESRTLNCLITPPIELSEQVDSITIVVRLDPHALFPRAARLTDKVGGSEKIRREYNASGELRVTITSAAGRHLTGDSLFHLDLEGLLTGKPLNRVEIVEIEIDGAPLSIARQDGQVTLLGCETGSGLTFGKRVEIESIHPNPSIGDPTLYYRTENDLAPTLSITDPIGRTALFMPLPAGPGHVVLPTGDLANGIYHVALLCGNQRTTTTLVIAR